MEAEYTKKNIENKFVITAGLKNNKYYMRCFLKGKEISQYSLTGRSMLDYNKLNESEAKANKLEDIANLT